MRLKQGQESPLDQLVEILGVFDIKQIATKAPVLARVLEGIDEGDCDAEAINILRKPQKNKRSPVPLKSLVDSLEEALTLLETVAEDYADDIHRLYSDLMASRYAVRQSR